MEAEIKNYDIGESSRNYHQTIQMINRKHGFHNDDDDLGPLPANWEKAYTENGETYFIDHATGQSHWLDPRLSKFQKKSLQDCDDDELPYGWEKIVDPEYGIYYIDHVNRKTQYENPVIQAKRELDMSKRMEAGAANFLPDNVDSPMEPKSFFTKNPSDLLGERIQTALVKSQRGLGFTIVGGDCTDDENIEEFLQIKSIVPNSPASADGKLKTGDILVFVNHICVLGFTHHEMVNIFQSIMAGDEVHLDVCRGYKLPFDPTDPNTEIVTTIAVNGINDEVEKSRMFLELSHDGYNFLDNSNDPDHMSFGRNQPGPSSMKGNSNFEIPELHDIIIIKGDQGFGFTIAESNLWGQKVKKILDRQCCKNLQEGDILLSINNINIKNLTHNEVVQVLKECPKNTETVLRVQRGLIRSSLNKFNGKARGKNDLKPSQNMTNGKPFMNGMFRSKTPTADHYSTQQKETLPIRPKTPLVDTRARIQMKTPIQMNDLNTDDIELDSKLTDHDDNKSTISTATTAYDTTKLLTEQFDNFAINDQRSDTYTTTDSITSKTSGGGRNRFFSPLDIKNGNGMDNGYHGGDYYYGNSSNSVYSLPPPPSIPTSQTRYIQPIQPPQQSASTIPYAHQPHDSCFCYDCQDYRIKQAQQSEYHGSNNNSDYSTLQTHFNMPPQMSDNVGKRINDYLMDRKRNAGEFYNNGNNNNFNSFRPNGNGNGNGHMNINGMDEFYYVEVTLERQALGFGFRIVGGTEEGSQVCVGYIVKDGAADRDPRIQTGDEILNINGVNVECASHHLVVKLMSEAALLGQVTMLLRKRKVRGGNTFYRPQTTNSTYETSVMPNTYDVVINRPEHEGFGFVIISSSNQLTGSTIGKIIPNSPADNNQLKIGDRIIRVNDIDISNLSHGDVVKIIKDSGLTVQLTVSNCITNPDPSQFIEAPFNPNIVSNGGMNTFPMLS